MSQKPTFLIFLSPFSSSRLCCSSYIRNQDKNPDGKTDQQQNQALAQQYIQTINHKNLVIDLGNGVKTNAQLTYPAVGKGPFPGVLLVAGGPVHMNYSGGYIRIDNKTGSKVYPPTLFFQIAQYLSERGFAVLRYAKSKS